MVKLTMPGPHTHTIPAPISLCGSLESTGDDPVHALFEFLAREVWSLAIEPLPDLGFDLPDGRCGIVVFADLAGLIRAVFLLVIQSSCHALILQHREIRRIILVEGFVFFPSG
ncbi:hypothetical protein KYN89_15265 [Alteriqipengyuania sp. NZ-12B]|uniref:Uncharacterized protein n=1 Tax=Alteriqipengyuania abyssalis TaxID=2860200 RepID=A0ABS7PKN0_9SPHN|nr:hypothetical protein [Alteriqipengyuania abyssalis]MBY8338407.1 hypothetical protein [Alteriqipengyuania abyssalis]